MDHAPAFWQENIINRPVEAAGAAQTCNFPASRYHMGLFAREHATPVHRPAIRTPARLAIIENLEAPQHPAALLAAATKAPVPGNPIAALDRNRLTAALHRSACDNRINTLRVDFLHTVLRQAEGHELPDAVVGHVPADRPQ